MTILALRGAEGERVRLLLLLREREREWERLRVPLRRSLMGERERPRALSSSSACGALSGVGERWRETLRRGGGDDMASTRIALSSGAVLSTHVARRPRDQKVDRSLGQIWSLRRPIPLSSHNDALTVGWSSK